MGNHQIAKEKFGRFACWVWPPYVGVVISGIMLAFLGVNPANRGLLITMGIVLVLPFGVVQYALLTKRIEWWKGVLPSLINRGSR